MSERVQILSVLNKPLSTKEGVLKIHNFLLEHGGYIDSRCSILLNDTHDIEIDGSEQIIDVEESLKKLYCWPSLGGIEYWMLKGMMNVFFWSTKPNILEMVQFSILDSVYNHENEMVKTYYQKLTKELHVLLIAKRTILGWNLKDFGFFWEEELARLDKNIFLEHEILELDLRLSH